MDLAPVHQARVGPVATVFFVNGAVYGSWAARLPALRDNASIGVEELGLALALAGATALVASVAAGPVVTRLRSRRAIVTSGAISGGALALTGYASGPVALTIGLALISAGDVVQDVAMNVQATALSDRRRAPIMGRLHGLWSLGTLVGGLTASRVAATDTAVSTHLLIVAAVLAVATARAAPGLAPRDDAPPIVVPGRVRRWRPAAGVLALGALAIGLEVVPADWAAIRMVDDLGAAPALGGLAFSVFVAGMLGGRLASDAVVARLGSRAVLVAGSAISAVGIIAAMLPGNRAVSISGFAVAGLGVAPVFPELYALAARVPGLRPGTGIALLTSGQRVASLAAPALVGGLVGAERLRVGEAAAAVAVPCAVALGLSIWARDTGRRHGPGG